ncbi:CARDB domain-containing protein [Hyalangium rubrum]|uniref:CARDB domain-containing protein n=1 Tax=Hyalangium rubrum TaxID=3103134 RepID=A0ABU5HHT3_9BACT|nr:CARDB domain-containing protein [Hyalangium sp. s54d21]MDY7233031.1 CARDB domain-containing protein [Hyalangium sp. s54d21]
MLAWVLVFTVLPGVGHASGDIVVIAHDGTPYSGGSDNASWYLPRQRVANHFYATHGDEYDFLVVLPTFFSSLGEDAAGLYTLVRNDVSGIGKPLYNSSAAFGSAGRLKGYIDLRSLMSGVPSSPETEAIVLAHEVAHQWSGQVGYRETTSSQRSEELLGRDGAHWSFFLDSQASVLYGSDWEARGPGSFESIGARRRLSELDLYLMGFLSPWEVGPLTLLSPAPGESHTAQDIPPPDGTRVSVTSRQLSLEGIIRAEGARWPDSAGSQKQFRAAFILLTAPGQSATPAQRTFAESLRRSFENHFFFLTRGRGLFETDLVERPPAPVAEAPSVQLGVSYLLSRQRAEGDWATRPEASLRETQQALDALRLFLSNPGVPASVDRAWNHLETRQPVDVDGLARLSLSMRGESPTTLARLNAYRQNSGSVGLSPGYRSTLLDTALLGLALTQASLAPDPTPEVTAFLLEQQNADGGWPALPGGPSRFEPTALVLEYLARIPRTPAITAAAQEAFAFFRQHRDSRGFFVEAGTRVATTGWALMSLATWRQLTAEEASRATSALLSRQRPDGSWEGSVVDTALALRALRIALTPNLTLSPGSIHLSATQVTAGETVLATVQLSNTGHAEAQNVLVQGFDSFGRPLGTGVRVASLAGGATTSVVLAFDTRDSGGSTQVFLVADPAGTLDEGQEDDNRAAVPLLVAEAPLAPDLFVHSGGVTLSPSSINRLPSQVVVTARVGNLGRTDAAAVEVVVRMGAQVLATSQLTLEAQSSQLASWTVQVSALQDAGRITVEVDPSNVVQEPIETNNAQSLRLGVSPGVDLRVVRVTAPATVDQGRDAIVQYELVNGGTAEGVIAGSLEITSESGALLGTVVLPSRSVSAGGTITGQLVWRANVVGSLRATLRAQHPGDLDRSNDTGSTTFEVQPSSLANLVAAIGTLSITPEPPQETKPATVSVTVRNSGQGQAQNFTVDFYLGVPESGGTRFHREQVATLAPGATLQLSGTLTLPQEAPETVYVILDGEQSVSEFDEEDNRTFLSISPAAIADLVVSAADIRPSPIFPRENTSVPVTVSVMNAGGQRAEGVSVELLRVGTNGSEELIGQTVIAAIEPGQRGEPILSWSTTGLRGAQRLVARVNGQGTVPEQRADNNRAERQISVQDAALALSELYFSPNGDGVRDVTDISYRLATEAAVEARIEDAQGRTVQLLTAPSAIASSLSWDGRSTAGRIVPDGTYRIHVRTLAPSPELLLGTLEAVVDTNRTPLDTSEPSALEVESLEGTASADMLFGPAGAMPDESGVVFRGREPGKSGCGLYHQSLGGAPARRLTPDAWPCDAYSPGSGGMAVSPNARWIAFHGRTTCASTESTCGTLELLSTPERQLRRLVLDEESPRRAILFAVAPVFSAEASRVFFATLDESLDVTEFRIEEIRVDGTQRRILARSSHEPVELSLSPDGSQLALLDSTGAVSLLALSDESRRAVLTAGTIAKGITPSGTPTGAGTSEDLRHGWTTSGEALIYPTLGWLQYAPPGSDSIYVTVDPRLEHKDLVTGEVRRLFTGPPGSWDFEENQAALAVHPVSGGTVFRYKPLLSMNPQLWTVSPMGTARMLHPYDVRGMRWSPGGSFLFGFRDAESSGGLSLSAVTTRDNLSVRLTATRTPGAPSITFQGTATDRNFEEWQISVRAYASSEPFVVIARSTTPVAAGQLAEWIPPQPGMYEAQLLARDRAGNVRTRTTVFGYSLSPAVANVSRTPELFSPNGDGVLDKVEIHYTATRATLVDFQILDARNQVVRQHALQHEQPGNFHVSWDGRDASGVSVPDGEYTVSLDGTRLSVEIDNTPPMAMLALDTSGVANLPAPYRYSDVMPVDLDPRASTDEGARTNTPVRIVVAGTSLKVQDAHLQEWALEVSSPEDPSLGRTLLTGMQAVDETRNLAVESLRGTFRLRVKDRAGNKALTTPVHLDDRLFITLVGAPEQIHLSWLLPGQVMPRVRPFTLARMNVAGITVLPRLPGGRYALGLNTTRGAHLVSFSVAYRTGTAPWIIIDTQNVTALGEAMVVWDARSAGTPSEFELRAVDSEGRLFSTPFTFSGPEDTQRTRFACVKTRHGEATVLSAFVGDALTRGADLAPGASWRFTSVETGRVTNFTAAPGRLVPTSAGLQVLQDLPTASLSGCRYEVDFLGTHQNGQPLTDRGTVDLCKLQLTASDDGIVLTESFRQALRSVEVFVDDTAPGVVARFGPFEGTSPLHPIDRSRFPTGSRHTLRAKTTLADGTQVLTQANLVPEDPNLLDRGCNDQGELQLAQSTLSLSIPQRDADASLCGIHTPTYTAKLTGGAGSGQHLQSLGVEIVSAQGEVVSRPAVSGVPMGASVVNTSFAIDAQTLPEGSYRVRASATWSDGSLTHTEAQPLFIDRTPAYTVVTRPAATGRVCPESRRGTDGAIKKYLVVEGAVADRHLESYELLLREAGGEPQQIAKASFSPAQPSSRQGVLGTVDVTHRGSSFELLLAARDVSGSSWCAEPLAVEVATPPTFGTPTLSPGLFSPDADGRFDTTMLQFTLDQAASVTVTAQTAGGPLHTILQSALPQGSASLVWNGRQEGGSLLADGTYSLRIRATGACDMTGEASALVRLDTQEPTARIDFPAEGQGVGASFSVLGEAADVNMARYELSIGSGTTPTQYTPIASRIVSASGVLGAVSLESLPPGEYTLRLVVEDLAGHTKELLRRFQYQPASLLRAASVLPSLISPDGDGVLETATLHIALAAPATVSAAILDGAGNPVRVLVEPTALPATSQGQLPLNPAALVGLPTGVYALRVSASAGAATDTAPAALEIDVDAPHLLLTSPLTGSVQRARLSIDGAIQDPSLESWSLTHVAPGENGPGQVIASGNSAASGVLAVRGELLEGTHHLLLEAHDRAGHTSEQSVSFTVDTTPPQAGFLSPLAGALLSGREGPLDIRGHAEDARLRLVRLEATTASGTQTLFSGPSIPPGGLLHSWAVGYDEEGPVELRLVAKDTAGNETESRISITLDSTPPVASLVEPRGGTQGQGLVFRGTAMDEHLSSWELELGRGTPGEVSTFQRLTRSTQPLSSGVLATLASVGEGSYVARLHVRDAAGNESTDEAAFTVDSIAPVPVPTLSATVERPNTVTLTWEPSPSSDVTTYELLRAIGSGPATLIATLASDTRLYLDSGLLDGRYRYSVRARDAAQNASPLSPEALVEIDATPPMALWLSPTPGEAVRGTVELQGTAYSLEDFREYRVSIGAGNTPASFTLLHRSLLPVSTGRLGELEVMPLPQGSIQTLRLEAEDLIGNVSEARVTFTVDNLPPTAPVLQSATVAGSTVLLGWQGSPEEDVLGYVPFRDGMPLGIPDGASPRDLRPYALSSMSRSYTDTSVPDGRHAYHLVAIDRAGNLSTASNSRQVTLETHPPVVRLIEPASLERVRHDTWLLAQGSDQDIASVRFEARGVPSGAFSLVGTPDTQAPYTALLPLSQFTSRIVELRAVAKDSANKVDPAPSSIHVLKEAMPSQPSITALVDGDQVALSWTDGNPTGLLAGFELSEAGVPVTIAPERWPGTASATSTASGSPADAYDSDPFGTSWEPQSVFPQAWTLELDEPVLLRGLSLTQAANAQLRLEARLDGMWVTLTSPVSATAFQPLTHALERPMEVDGVRVTFLSVISGDPALYDVQLDALPLEHGTTTLLASVPEGRHTYSLRAMGFGGTPSEASTVSVRVYAPWLEASADATPESSMMLQGREVPPSAQVQLLGENGVVATTTADARGHFLFNAPLVLGTNSFQVLATDGAGNRSLPSETVTVVSDPAPSAALTLALDAVTGSDVSLSFTVAGESADVVGYVLVRESATGTVELPSAPADVRGFVDRGVRNGAHTYRVHAFNPSGFRGPASNAVSVTVDVAPPAAPVEVAVEPLPSGGALAVSWAPGDARTVAYRVERAIGADGAFEVLAGSERVITSQLVDLFLSDDTLYRYRIIAFDALGNPSSPSAIATGVPVDSTPPAAPRLTRPTVAGKPITVASPTTTLAGLTEPGTRVTLFRNDEYYAQASAGALRVEGSLLELSLTPVGSGWPSEDGRRVAYLVESSLPGTEALAVETRSGELLGTFRDASLQFIREVTFSPDGQRLVLQTWSGVTFLASLDTGEVRQLAPLDHGADVSASWAPNSHEVAYASNPSGTPAIVVVDITTGSERWLTGASDEPLMAPRHAPDGQSLFALTSSGSSMRLLRMAPMSEDSTTLFEAASINPRYAISPDSERIALVATREGQTDVYLVSTSTGASVRLTHGPESEFMPAFSRDGRRLAFRRGGDLVIHEDGREQRFEGLSDLQWSWDHEGALLASSTVGLTRLDWGARFEFTGVRLEPGDTLFSATATDPAQRTSSAATPIQITLDATTLPDLVAEVLLRPEVPRAGQPFDAFVTVRNQGGGSAPATTLSVAVLLPDGRSMPPQLISLPTLPAGGMTTAVVALSHPELSGPLVLEAIVDPQQQVDDAVRDNNRVHHPFSLALDDKPVVSVSVSPASVEVNGESLATLTVANPGAARTVDVEVWLVTSSGEPVFQVGAVEHLAPLGEGRSITFTRHVNVARTLAGSYLVKAKAREGSALLSEAETPLSINADRATHLRLTSSRARYVTGESLVLATTVRNDSANSFLDGASYTLSVTGPTGAPVLESVTALPLLAQGASHSVRTEWSSLGLEPGQYEARGVITLGSRQLATATVRFSISGRPLLSGTLLVLGDGAPPVIRAGQALTVDFAAVNQGSTVEPSLALRVAIIDPDTGLAVRSHVLPAQPLEVGESLSGQHDFSTLGLPLKSYAVYLLAERPDGTVQALSTAQFRLIDGQAPVLQPLNLTDGMYVSGSVLPLLRALDAESGVAFIKARIDAASSGVGMVLTSGTVFDGTWSIPLGFSGQGPHTIVFSTEDRAGNAGQVSLTVINDTRPPAISISGVKEGARFRSPAVPVIEVADASPTTVSILLDGAPFSSGTAITTDGEHTLVVQATDGAGNPSLEFVRFTVDMTEPWISFGDLRENGFYRQNVTPFVTIRDWDLQQSTLTLNGQPFTSGSAVSTEGTHVLRAWAKDGSGNQTERQARFTLDRTPPTVTLSGVSGGAQYRGSVTPVIVIQDAHLATQEVRLDDAPFRSGTPVTDDGNHTLTVRAEDSAGWVTEQTVQFSVQAESVNVTQVAAASFSRVLALVHEGTCSASASELRRIQSLLETELGGPDRLLTVATSEAAFLEGVRSGVANVFLVISLDSTRGECREGQETSGNEPVRARQEQLRKAWTREVTEQVFAGHAGLVVLRAHAASLPGLREVLGVDFQESPRQNRVRLPSSALEGPAYLNAPMGGTRLQVLDSSVQAAALYADSHEALAGALYTFGQGRSVTFGFDLTSALPGAHAALALRKSVAYVTPSSSRPTPLGVAGVELRLANPSHTSRLRVVEKLPAPLTATWASSEGTLAPDGHEIIWEPTLARGMAHEVRFLVRLPEVSGSHTVSASVDSLRSAAPFHLGTRNVNLAQPLSSAELLTRVREALAAHPKGEEHKRLELEARLRSVEARPVTQREDIEALIEDLFVAVDATRHLGGDSRPVRQALGDLIRYWEARWYLF